MLRFFDMFLGRSTVMQALEDALRASGLHPLLVPEPVKLTMIELAKKHAPTEPQDATFLEAATLLAYCVLGHEQFADSNDPDIAERADQRVEAALEHGDTFDAKLVLLALHAGLISPEIADRIEMEEP
jgi:hypothetical protein